MKSVLADDVRNALEKASWIRRMFEEGGRLIAERGAENVFNFTLGNPLPEPPEAFHQAVRQVVDAPVEGQHRYLPNAGLPDVRKYVAEHLSTQTGLPYTENQIVMTTGAAGALNVALKALLNPGDEVIAFTPYFVEYDFYAANHGGKLVRVDTDDHFQLDLGALKSAITPQTRAVLINSPNNPSGAVYPEEDLKALAQVLREASDQHGRPILLISDEPYRYIVFDGTEVPWVPALYEHTLLATSHSKDIGLAGERVGYLAISPTCADQAELMDACVFANRVLGFVSAPGIVQRVLPLLKGKLSDLSIYTRLRDKMVPPLLEMGYELVPPKGAFYLFPRSPIPDDVAFVKEAQEEGLLLVPGSGFGRPGYFRIALCVEEDVVDRALPVFEKLIKKNQT